MESLDERMSYLDEEVVDAMEESVDACLGAGFSGKKDDGNESGRRIRSKRCK